MRLKKFNDEAYQIRFDALSSISDKAYRILFETNKPMHIREILREINYRQIKAGAPANVPLRSLQQRLVSNNRFTPIGRSGEWILSNWKTVSKDTILELMQEFFHLKQKSAAGREIYEYVQSKRESVSLKSVYTYLGDQKSLFTKVDKGMYALAAWGMQEYRPLRKGQQNSVQIDKIVQAIFNEKQVDTLPLWQTIEEIKARTGKSRIVIRKWIDTALFLKLEPHPTFARRKVIKYLAGGNDVPTADKAKKITIREKVQKEVTKFLLEQRDNTAPLSVISTHVIKKTNCKKASFYRYTSEMENIQKENLDGTVMCKISVILDEKMKLKFSQVEAITDNELRDNLKRAIDTLTIDNVDLGLFQLGKIFEIELREYLQKAKAKNSFPVTHTDLSKLVAMIDCLERNKIITKKHHLTLLREQRNERAHGDIPNLNERQKLLEYAPFLGDLYIDYTILLNKKRSEL